MTDIVSVIFFRYFLRKALLVTLGNEIEWMVGTARRWHESPSFPRWTCPSESALQRGWSLIYWVALGTNYGMVRYDRSITVNTTPIYAVTYREQDNGNVGRLVEWMLSEEGQCIIEETGYVGLER